MWSVNTVDPRPHSADQCPVVSNTQRMISCFNWFSLQQGHLQTHACVCARACVCVPHNWGGHIPISSASCGPLWIWQLATGPFPQSVFNVYGPEVQAPWILLWYSPARGAWWNFFTLFFLLNICIYYWTLVVAQFFSYDGLRSLINKWQKYS